MRDDLDPTDITEDGLEISAEPSTHALKRGQQRGCRQRILDIVTLNGDIVRKQPGHRTSLRLSRQKKLELIRCGTPVQDVERAERVELVVAQDGTLVTVLKIDPSKRLRLTRYRRGHLRRRRIRHGR